MNRLQRDNKTLHDVVGIFRHDKVNIEKTHKNTKQ